MARKFSTAGVTLQEIDASDVLVPLGTSTGAIVGRALKGPANRRVLVNNDKGFIDSFGEPDYDNLSDYGAYGAIEFLKESNALYFVRATNGTEIYANRGLGSGGITSGANVTATSSDALTAVNGYSDGNGIDDIYDLEQISLGSDYFNIAAIGPGAWGNNIGITVTTSADLSSSTYSADVDWKFSYDDDPDTDPVIWKKVFKIEVFVKSDTAADFSGVSANTPDETWYVSRESVIAPDGKNLNIEEVINGFSKYIYIKNATGTTLPGSVNTVTGLTKGSDGSGSLGGTERIGAWNLFSDKNKVKVNILLETSDASNTTLLQSVGNIASSRQDCIAVIQADQSTHTTTSQVISGVPTGFVGPSYVAMYSGWPRIQDRYTSKKLYVPLCIYGAAIMARTDRVANVWDAPAGLNRGTLSGIIGHKVAWTDAQIGQLSDRNVNTFKFIEGRGHFLWDQRTAQRKATALQSINVRRNLLFIESSIENVLQEFLFEVNNERTRLQIFNTIDPFLSEILAAGGLTEKLVVVDDTNNTAQVINNELMYVDIYVKPARVARNIILRTVVTKEGVSFQEVLQ